MADFQNLQKARAAVCLEIVHSVMNAVFTEHLPADLVLERIFRTHRKYGSRDRRFLGDTVFAVFRWFGFLRKLGPLQTPFPPEQLAVRICGAYAAEGVYDPVLEPLLLQCGKSAEAFQNILKHSSPLERFRLFSGCMDLQEKEILPECVYAHLASEFTPELFQRLQSRTPSWIRLQNGGAKLLMQEGISPECHPRISCAARLPAKINGRGLHAFRKGLFEFQDLSSQCIGLAAAPAAGEHWWDACCGGGGKTLQLLSLMNNQGTVTASDIRKEKLEEVGRRAAKAKAVRVYTACWKGNEKFGKKLYDGVLTDAPCSSSGRWRRNPEGRFLFREEELAELVRLQKQILHFASMSVAPGGVLVYATCSIFRDENADQASAFLAEHPEFQREPFCNPLNGEMTDGSLQILPDQEDCDGAFIAKFRRKI